MWLFSALYNKLHLQKFLFLYNVKNLMIFAPKSVLPQKLKMFVVLVLTQKNQNTQNTGMLYISPTNLNMLI